MFVFLIQDGQPHPNKHGEVPTIHSEQEFVGTEFIQQPHEQQPVADPAIQHNAGPRQPSHGSSYMHYSVDKNDQNIFSIGARNRRYATIRMQKKIPTS